MKSKKMQRNNDASDNDAIPAAPASAPLSAGLSAAGDVPITGLGSSLATSASLPSMASASKPASQAADETSSLSQPWSMRRQRGQQPEGNGANDDQGGGNDAPQQQQQQQQGQTYLQLSLPSHPFGFGSGGGNSSGSGARAETTSILAAGSIARCRSGPVGSFPFLPARDDARGGSGSNAARGRGKSPSSSPPGSNTSNNNKGTASVSEVPLTRTISTPEPSYRRPLQDDLNLKQDYPLSLQRSASSAFGSPSSFGRLKAIRANSNSGNSDPGASAFHPVWSCKSLSTSSAASHSGSEQGSAVGSGTSSHNVRSAHSDPLGGSERVRSRGRKNSSPWKLGNFMARMRKSSSGGGGGNSGSGSGNKGNSFKRSLSGRENPARPDLSADEGSPVNEMSVFVPTIHSGDELSKAGTGDELILDMSRMNLGDKESAKAGSGEESASKKMASGSKPKVKGKPLKKKPSAASSNASEESTKMGLSAKPDTEVEQYDDPGVALDLSESESDDDDIIGPIAGNYIPLDDIMRQGSHSRDGTQSKQQNPRPLSIELPHPPSMDEQCEEHTSFEVVSTSVTPTFLHRPSSRAEGTTVIEDTAFGSVHIFSPQTSMPSPTSIEENSPPTVERVTIEEAESDGDAYPYHPLGGDGIGQDDHEDAVNDRGSSDARVVPVMLKYRSPQRSQPPPRSIHSNNNGHQDSPSSTSHDSPDSRLSSNRGSPTSRISSSNSRATASTHNSGGDRSINTLQTEGSLVLDGMDSEIRDANRRSSVRGIIGINGNGREANNQETTAGPDGNETVFSSSTTSSNYNSYLASPRQLRDGATMRVEPFFAGGNVTMSPSPRKMGHPDYGDAQHGLLASGMVAGAPSISKFIELSPKKISRRRDGSGISRDATHSPHTVSSNSVSNNSSSSGETMKKPLQFVAYQIQEEREGPFDEPTTSSGVGRCSSITSSLIQPRISKIGSNHQRPPMTQPSYKPPQSPRKQDTAAAYAARLSGARTPTRTPPPSSYNMSGANTPCSPPVIVDGPSNVLCGDLSMNPTRPSVVRRSSAHAAGGGRGMFLIPPSAASSYRPHHPRTTPQPSADAASAMSSPLQANLKVDGKGVNTGAQEIVFSSTPAPTIIAGGEAAVSSSALVSPDRQTFHHPNASRGRKPIVNIAPKPDLKSANNAGGTKHRNVFAPVATVSPEKGI